jgi:anti-sigma B factor antagonist
MEISKKKTNDLCILELNGSLTLGDRSQVFRQTVEQALRDGDRKFIFNFGGIRMMDSSGLGELLAIKRIVANQNGMMKFCKLNDQLSSLIRISHLREVFEIYRSEQQAIDSYEG